MQGGLLGQFVGAHHDGSTVFSMATDEKNKVLLTGDTSGYVKVRPEFKLIEEIRSKLFSLNDLSKLKQHVIAIDLIGVFNHTDI